MTLKDLMPGRKNCFFMALAAALAGLAMAILTQHKDPGSFALLWAHWSARIAIQAAALTAATGVLILLFAKAEAPMEKAVETGESQVANAAGKVNAPAGERNAHL